MAQTQTDDNFLDFLINESNFVTDDTLVAAVPNEKDANDVPGHMIPTDRLKAAAPDLYDAPLLEIWFGNSVEDLDTLNVATFRDALVKNTDGRPTVCLVLRRPGCCFCREDGQELSKLAETEDINLIGIVKDVRDKKGLHQFHKHYFPFRIYKDVDLKTYAGMGSRKISLSQLVCFPKGYARIRQKKIRANMTSLFDTVQGGVLIFDAEGELRYCYHEQYADQLHIEDIQAAIHAVKPK